MRRTRFDDAECPIARTTDLIADWWTPLILREFFYGRRRFDEFTEALDISRAVLSTRLKRLEIEGVITRRPYADRPTRFEYRLTEKGRALWDVLAAMFRFGDDWMFDDGAPVGLVDRTSGDAIRPLVVDEATGVPLDVRRTLLVGITTSDESAGPVPK